jgi:hypothetical protein
MHKAVLTEDHDHVDGVRLRLRTAATSGRIVHPAGDISAQRTIMGYLKGEKSQFVHTVPTVANQEELDERNDELRLRNIFVHTSK